MYEDIINLPHWEPSNHPRMPLENRAAQFAPFAALVGHEAAIQETARLTDQMIELDVETYNQLNVRIKFLDKNLDKSPIINVTHFVPDNKKAGGRYINHCGIVKRIDEIEQTITFADGTIISIAHIKDINSDIFNNL